MTLTGSPMQSQAITSFWTHYACKPIENLIAPTFWHI